MTTQSPVWIYGLCDPFTYQLRYVGASNNPEKRYQQHLTMPKNNYYANRWIRKLLQKNSPPEMFIIEQTDIENWGASERFWIAYFKYIGANLTNLCAGGYGVIQPSLQTRKKRSNSMKRYLSSNKPSMLGRHHSRKTKRRMRKSRLELLTHWKCSEASKQKTSKSMIGKPKSEECKQHMRHPHKTYRGRKVKHAT